MKKFPYAYFNVPERISFDDLTAMASVLEDAEFSLALVGATLCGDETDGHRVDDRDSEPYHAYLDCYAELVNLYLERSLTEIDLYFEETNEKWLEIESKIRKQAEFLTQHERSLAPHRVSDLQSALRQAFTEKINCAL